MAFRHVAAKLHPVREPSANLRKRFLRVYALFADILGVAQQMGVLKLGKLSLDGPMRHANACGHAVLNWDHARSRRSGKPRWSP